MSVSRAIEHGGVVAYKVAYTRLPGSSITAAIFLSQVAYWVARSEEPWVAITHERMEEQTGLTREQQDLAAKKLKAIGVLQKAIKGLPGKIHYSIDFEQLDSLLENQGCGKSTCVKPTPADVGNTQQLVCETHTHTNVRIHRDSLEKPPPEKKSKRRIQNANVSDNPPTLKEWVAYGQEKYPMAPSLEMKKAFDFYEGHGWTRKESETTRVALTNWKSTLTNWLATWARENPGEVARWKRSQVPAQERVEAAKGLQEAVATPSTNPTPHKSVLERYREMQREQ
jgi:hypothetical protein